MTIRSMKLRYKKGEENERKDFAKHYSKKKIKDPKEEVPVYRIEQRKSRGRDDRHK
jgi:hypothetical protein